MNPYRLATLVAALSLAFATDASLAAGVATTPAAGAPGVVSSGLDKSGMDAAVRPQDDLFRAMNGTWVKNTAIPSDKSSAGSFVMLDDLSNERVKSVIESLAATPQPVGTVDEHSPAAFRADGAAIDSDGFHAAFGTKPGDAMYQAPADRIRLW